MDNRERDERFDKLARNVASELAIGDDVQVLTIIKAGLEKAYRAWGSGSTREFGEARAAIEGGAACPECTLGPPNWSERKPGYCSYCNDTGLRPKVRERVLEAAPRDV